jgi:hypothetical protein
MMNGFLPPIDPITDDSYNAAMATDVLMAQGGNGRIRQRTIACMVAVMLFCWLAACGSTKKTLSAQAQVAGRVDTVIAQLQTELGRCNRRGITALLAPPLENDETFSRRLAELCDQATAIRPVFVVERMWLKNAETVRADIQWTLRADLASPNGVDSPTGNRQPGGATMVIGTAHFTLVGKESPRVTAIDGDNPFAPQFDQALVP